ncbi:uncharacterized protein AMSG_02441 [Thecamonas trahens ATCC 50062]|uniref:Uncharacterized protein n=1 Tax=Thecamonas trahens ATCC 50062 TaxID=461836 RepID=A0A0L0DY39_THETB|nr:hypothetical protein AMSG_02441 [Thecamonas trahens ATCC 50062]KNC56473.1 hypothetical protein AMSG_02441 [Thecamonas trahens ATCC 50062]|eukprot:XP_013760982.1 hypothetical protein AMSG_02441 [Thecamonas trahens ATCC 50062]
MVAAAAAAASVAVAGKSEAFTESSDDDERSLPPVPVGIAETAADGGSGGGGGHRRPPPRPRRETLSPTPEASARAMIPPRSPKAMGGAGTGSCEFGSRASPVLAPLATGAGRVLNEMPRASSAPSMGGWAASLSGGSPRPVAPPPSIPSRGSSLVASERYSRSSSFVSGSGSDSDDSSISSISSLSSSAAAVSGSGGGSGRHPMGPTKSQARALGTLLSELDLESKAYLMEEVLPSGRMRSVQVVIGRDAIMTWLIKPLAGGSGASDGKRAKLPAAPQLTLQYKHNFPRILEFQTNDVRRLFMYKYEPGKGDVQLFRYFSPAEHHVVFDAVMERVAVIAAYLEKLRRKQFVARVSDGAHSPRRRRRRRRRPEATASSAPGGFLSPPAAATSSGCGGSGGGDVEAAWSWMTSTNTDDAGDTLDTYDSDVFESDDDDEHDVFAMMPGTPDMV